MQYRLITALRMNRKTYKPGTVLDRQKLLDAGVDISKMEVNKTLECIITENDPDKLRAMHGVKSVDENDGSTMLRNLQTGNETQVDPEGNMEVSPSPNQPKRAEKTHEGLSEEKLSDLDSQALVVSVLERIEDENDKQIVKAFLADHRDPKAASLLFLTASYNDRADFVKAVREEAEELARVDEIAQAASETGPEHTDKMGKKSYDQS